MSGKPRPGDAGPSRRSRGGTAAALSLVVRRSLRQHALSTLVTIVSMALASGLVMAVWSLQAQTYAAFTGGGAGFDAVLGSRGSQLQLVLNAVFHMETSPGNIPWSLYKQMRDDPRITLAVPYAVGDNYRGFRIVGTTQDLFTSSGPRGGRALRLEPGGRLFGAESREAILGSLAARRTGLKVGDRLRPTHGLAPGEGGAEHQEEFLVTGVLAPTNGPADRVLWVPIEAVLHMSGHVLRGTGDAYEAHENELIPEEHKEVSAVLLRLRNPQAGFALEEEINRRGKTASLAWPISRVTAELFDKLGWVNRVLELVAYLVVVVAAGSILASIHNSIHERRRDLAILRALGARRRVVFSAVVLEAAVISGFGSLGGYFVCGGILIAAAAVVRAQTGVVLEVLHFHPVLAVTPPAMVLLGALAGVLPAWKAYSTNVAETLSPIS